MEYKVQAFIHRNFLLKILKGKKNMVKASYQIATICNRVRMRIPAKFWELRHKWVEIARHWFHQRQLSYLNLKTRHFTKNATKICKALLLKTQKPIYKSELKFHLQDPHANKVKDSIFLSLWHQTVLLNKSNKRMVILHQNSLKNRQFTNQLFKSN